MNPHDFRDVVGLMSRSEYHKGWLRSELDTYIVPPLNLGQYMMFRKGFYVVGFATWAWFSKEAANGFVTKERRVQPQDWNSGKELWVMDFICLDKTRLRKYILKMRKKLGDEAFFIRSNRPSLVRGRNARIIENYVES